MRLQAYAHVVEAYVTENIFSQYMYKTMVGGWGRGGGMGERTALGIPPVSEGGRPWAAGGESRGHLSGT